MDDRSERNLIGVHPDLVMVVRKAYEDWTVTGGNFIVTEGLRTPERQAQLVKAGASWSMDSRHLIQPDGFGHAVDLAVKVGHEVRWDWPLYHRLAGVMKSCARDIGVAIIAGADWPHLRDGPHFELDRAHYGADQLAA